MNKRTRALARLGARKDMRIMLNLFFGLFDFVPGRGKCEDSTGLTNAHVQFLGCERREGKGREQGRGMGEWRQGGREGKRKREGE
jgi:hypothetical protein